MWGLGPAVSFTILALHSAAWTSPLVSLMGLRTGCRSAVASSPRRRSSKPPCSRAWRCWMGASHGLYFKTSALVSTRIRERGLAELIGSSSMAFEELKEELEMIARDPPTGWCEGRCSYISGQFLYWQGMVLGPEATPYEDGFFRVVLVFSHDPLEPPEVSMSTKIFHQNVDLEGFIRAPLASPRGSVRELLTALRQLLAEPQKDHVVPEIAWMRKHHRLEHDQLARRCAQRFASV